MLVNVQDVVFPKPNICDVEEMYYRKIGIPSSNEIYRDKIVFKNRQRINFDTYYNSLSLLKWVKYTYASTNFALKIKLKGKFLVNLVHMYLEGDGVLRYETIARHNVDTREEKEFIFEYFTSNPFGCLNFNLECFEDGSVFYGASYVSDVLEPLNDVKLGIGICTFKREKYVENNINNIKTYIFNNQNSDLKENLEIFISDNAQSLNVEELKNNHVHIFKNKNTGGSGGFTRCMIEAINYNEREKDKLTHLILMDDDIKFDPTSIERTYSILRLLRPEYMDAFVGGAMFKMDKPTIQHCSGEFWHKDRPDNFIESYNQNRNLTDIKQILENENFTNSNHQGWWFCAIPMKFIRKDNLSMPFFIKSDDIEFGARNMKTQILMNGINVWHESFESKYSAQNEYYTVRNYLISAAAQNADITKEDILKMFRSYTRHYICNYKYIEIQHFCNAINDFLKGVDHFKKIDLESYHKSILSKGYKMVDVKELPVKFTDEQYYQDISFAPHWSKFKRFIEKYTINGLLLPAKGYAVLGMWGGGYEQTYRKKFLIRYEINTKKGFILKRNRKLAIKMLFLYNKTKKKIKKYFDKAYKEFQSRWRELITIENWNNYLDLKK